MTASPDGGVSFHRRSRRGKDAREMTSLPVGSASAAVVLVVVVVVVLVVVVALVVNA